MNKVTWYQEGKALLILILEYLALEHNPVEEIKSVLKV